MPRGPRIAPNCGVFHIMVRGNNKRCVFRRACEYRYFMKLIDRYKRKFCFLLYHYVLMKNHIHLSIQATDKTNISKLMQGIELSYYHYYRKRRKYVGHMWQGRFVSKLIEDDSYLLESGLYIEKNPVEAGLSENPENYPWSSYNFYALGVEDPIIDTNPAYMSLGGTPEDRQKVYRELMTERINGNKNKNVHPVFISPFTAKV